MSDLYQVIKKVGPLNTAEDRELNIKLCQFLRSGEKNEEMDDLTVELLENPCRDNFTTKYAWAVPDEIVMEKLKQFCGERVVVEVGSGKGLWAKLMRAKGINVIATDLYVDPEAFTLVEELDCVETVKRYSNPKHILMMVWPPQRYSMSSDTLSNFREDTLIYVGEPQGFSTGCDDFFEMLKAQWTLKAIWDIPQWPGVFDGLYIFQRN